MEIRHEVINGMLAINVTGIPDPLHPPRLQVSHGAGGWEVTAIPPQALERLDAAVIADNVELMTGFSAAMAQESAAGGIEWPRPPNFELLPTPFPTVPISSDTIIDVVVGVPDSSLQVLTLITDTAPHLATLPSGSICETCWDQPATQLLPAPWGGEMGSCVGCAKGEGEEDAVRTALETQAQFAGVTFEQARESFNRLLAVVGSMSPALPHIPESLTEATVSPGVIVETEIEIAPGVPMENIEAVWINGVRYVSATVDGYRIVSASSA